MSLAKVSHYEMENIKLKSLKSIQVFSTIQIKNSLYHDHRRRIHELSEQCVRKVVEYWKTGGPSWVRQRNFEAKELLEDFDTSIFDRMF